MDAKPDWPAFRVERRPITSLKPYPNNARTHSAEQVAQVTASIREFGWTNPVLIDDKDGVIAGHARLMAAAQLGAAEVPVIVAKGWSEAQKRAYVLADNQLALNAGWDENLLRIEIGALGEGGFDLGLLGFPDDFLADLLTERGGLTDPDEAPPLPAVPITQRGDLWICGNHRILCGDATDAGDVARLLGGRRAHVCLTDPPYGIGDSVSSKNDYVGYEDTRENLVSLIAGFLPLARTRSDRIVLTPGNGNLYLYPEPTWVLAWFTPAGVGRGPWGFCCWQPIACYGADPKLAAGKGCHPDAVVHTEAAEKLGHPCGKPVNFWRWLMQRVSERGHVVYDPFVGSGTTMIAAEMEGRSAFCMEISEAYCDVAVQRWEAFTGKTATREVARAEAAE